jgi:hypothetical protein
MFCPLKIMVIMASCDKLFKWLLGH